MTCNSLLSFTLMHQRIVSPQGWGTQPPIDHRVIYIPSVTLQQASQPVIYSYIHLFSCKCVLNLTQGRILEIRQPALRRSTATNYCSCFKSNELFHQLQDQGWPWGGIRNFVQGQKIQGGLDGHGTPSTLKTASLDLHDYHKCHRSMLRGQMPGPPPSAAPVQENSCQNLVTGKSDTAVVKA